MNRSWILQSLQGATEIPREIKRLETNAWDLTHDVKEWLNLFMYIKKWTPFMNPFVQTTAENIRNLMNITAWTWSAYRTRTQCVWTNKFESAISDHWLWERTDSPPVLQLSQAQVGISVTKFQEAGMLWRWATCWSVPNEVEGMGPWARNISKQFTKYRIVPCLAVFAILQLWHRCFEGRNVVHYQY